MYIESYKAGGKKYYRVKDYAGVVAHLGTAELILSKVRPDICEKWRSEEKTEKTPRTAPDDDTELKAPNLTALAKLRALSSLSKEE